MSIKRCNGYIKISNQRLLNPEAPKRVHPIFEITDICWLIWEYNLSLYLLYALDCFCFKPLLEPKFAYVCSRCRHKVLTFSDRINDNYARYVDKVLRRFRVTTSSFKVRGDRHAIQLECLSNTILNLDLIDTGGIYPYFCDSKSIMRTRWKSYISGNPINRFVKGEGPLCNWWCTGGKGAGIIPPIHNCCILRRKLYIRVNSFRYWIGLEQHNTDLGVIRSKNQSRNIYIEPVKAMFEAKRKVSSRSIARATVLHKNDSLFRLF